MQSAGSADTARAPAHDGRADRRGPPERRSARDFGAAPGRNAAHRRFLSGDVQKGERAVGARPQAGAALSLAEQLTAFPSFLAEILSGAAGIFDRLPSSLNRDKSGSLRMTLPGGHA